VTLERLFAGKCAYCETRYAVLQPVDIEHWRPKAEVEVDGQKTPIPGYEWLAAVWDNLLPSCIDCNRQRNHSVFTVGDEGQLEMKPAKLGKGNYFPLVDEARRARDYRQDIRLESPLLVNPCSEDPEAFFSYRTDGVVVPKAGLDLAKRKRALESIRIYALNRKPLVDERHEKILLLRSRFELITALIELETELNKAMVGIAEALRVTLQRCASCARELIDRELAFLDADSEPTREYSAMVRQFVREFLAGLTA
jgi:hypothetical protein